MGLTKGKDVVVRRREGNEGVIVLEAHGKMTGDEKKTVSIDERRRKSGEE
jgi:hypothetical protein